MTQILYQKSGSLGISNDSHNLEVICEAMCKNEVDIRSFVETNTHWKHEKSLLRFKQILNQFWGRRKNSTSEIITPWKSIYELGGSVIIYTSNIASTIIKLGEDEEELGCWSYVTYGGRNQTKVTIISTYRPYVPNENEGVSTTHSQQWELLEERRQEHESIREKLIKYLTTLIHS